MNNLNVLYCRFCAQSKLSHEMMDVDHYPDKRRELVDMLLRLNVGDWNFFGKELLPNTVCMMCCDSLQQAYVFVLSVAKAQKFFIDLIDSKNLIKEEVVYVTLKHDSGSDGSVVNKLPDPCDSMDKKSLDTDSDSEASKDTSTDPTTCIVFVKTEADRSEYLNTLELPNETQETLDTKRDKRKGSKKLVTKLDSLPMSQQELTWQDFLWICSYCDTHYSTISELRSHSIEFHQSCHAYRCMDCKISRSRLDKFILHVKCHKKYLKFSCYICLEKFSTSVETNHHQLTHYATNHKCPGCNTCFPTKEDLTQHAEMYYKAKKANHTSILKSVTDDLTCLLCSKIFKSKGNLSNHLLTHTDRKRDHTCDKCGKRFFNKQTLAGHFVLHDDTRPHKCDVCKFAFKTKNRLRTHMVVHGNKMPYACDQCGRCFRLHKQLQRHKIIHTDSMPYTCKFCSKKFRCKQYLDQHLRQHTGERPYSCTICHRDFTNWPNCNKHMKRLHGVAADAVKRRNKLHDEKIDKIDMYQEINSTTD